MNKKYKIKYFFILLLSFISSISLIINVKPVKMKTINNFLANNNLSYNTINKVLIDFKFSLTYENIILLGFLFLSILILFCYVNKKYSVNRSEKICFFILSFVFSFFVIYSKIVYLDTIYKVIILKSLVKMVGLSFLFYNMIILLYKNIFCLFENSLNNNFILNKRNKIILFSALIIFFCWLPYIIAYYPGILMDDSVDQIRQIFGLTNVTYLRISNPLSPSIFINDSNPVFNTFLLSIFIKLGQLINNLGFGVFLFSIIQVFINILVFSYSLYFILNLGVNKKVVFFVLIFYSLFPLIPMYSYTLCKTSLFGAFYLMYIMMFFKLAYNVKDNINNKNFLFYFAIIELLMMLLIKHGIYIVLLSGIGLLFYKFKYWKKISLVLTIPILIFQILFTSMLLPALGISKGKSAEMYSIPFQQTARYVTYYGNEVTSSEKETINKVLIYNKIVKNYNPTKSDGIKDRSYRSNHTLNDMKSYIRVWFKMFFKHPLCYFDATFINNVSYFDPNEKVWFYYKDKDMERSTKFLVSDDVFLSDTGATMRTYSVKDTNQKIILSYKDVLNNTELNKNEKTLIYKDKKTKKEYELKNNNNLWISSNVKFDSFRDMLFELTNIASKIPGIGLFFSMASYTWIFIVLLGFAFFKRDKNTILFLIPTIVNYLILIAGPYAGFRYLYPLLQSFFIIIFVVFQKLFIKNFR
ncbi:DUF6020 family protein [Anaerofustis stercorihominis]|uniref:DUF6020 family protein n=1 Tax=Anaerofustis stercorihominis TaxID=214853 RepID=UPI00214B61A1|nr:DUF6020 family protein [Anaerofustis stercorihominis]MCR2033577.1 DUF6020 family protein [Anaerofustis stercorihominis]